MTLPYMSNCIEFDCEGCGVHVFAVGRDSIPKSHMCSTCEWMNEHIPDPEEMMRIRKKLEKDC